MLYGLRRRQLELEAREASGASFWTDAFSERVRNRLAISIDRVLGNQASEAKKKARTLILAQEGLLHLFDSNSGPISDFNLAVSLGADDLMPTLIEAVIAESGNLLVQDTFTPINPRYADFRVALSREIAEILYQERIAFDLVDGRMVPFSSRELHSEVVVPALVLLAATEGLAAVETAYQGALAELAAGRSDNAITDAVTALEEMLGALGAEGTSLGARFTKAKRHGLLTSYDQRLVLALDDLMGWATADRGDKGDAHTVSDAVREDAWLAIHIVGAIIVRLASGVERSVRTE